MLTAPVSGQVKENPCPGFEKTNASQAWFAAELWSKVASVECLKCHKSGGDAEETRLVLQDPTGRPRDQFQSLMRQNFFMLTELAQESTDGQTLLLAKVTGGLDHGGGKVIKPDSAAFRILENFVQRTLKPEVLPESLMAVDQTPFFEGVTMVDDVQLLRRATLSLAGRLPTSEESDRVRRGGQEAVAEILDQVLNEEAFYERLREAFNDIFLTLGVDGNPDQTVLSYEHFEKTRGWYQRYDLSHIEDEKDRRQAGYKLANEYRKALLDEPMRLIDYIVRNDRPFTEIVTADYIMVSPYSSRGYGVYEKLQGQFKNSENPYEYVPVKLKALVGRSRKEDQESGTGFYPHAGVLSTFQYLSRYPTTETNRNRLRARMYYQHFLGVDVLELAARGSDAAAVTAQFDIPTMQASECVVCHKTLDPVAGLFQDYWRFDTNFSIYGRRKEGWFHDMFSAGFEGEALPPEERWRALQWLGERTAEDPRFARTMVGHAYFLLTGRRPHLRPTDLDDPLYAFRERAWRAQQCQIDSMAQEFASSEFNFKHLLKDWVLSDFYRVNGLESQLDSAGRRVELDEIGVVRLLSPEQLERKINAIFGQPWGQLNGQTAMLYGGIDSKEVTERVADPSGAMGAIQRTMSNDVACKNVALDFSRPQERRVLFPEIEPDVIPRSSPEADEQIRAAIVHLHQHLLGRVDKSDSKEVQRTFELFADVVQTAKSRGPIDPQESWSCRQGLESVVTDPYYTVRGWRAVVTYLLRQPEFLYE